MAGQIVEISSDNKHLCVDRGFLSIREDTQELAKIPFDMIEAVIANAHGITYSNNLLVRLAENKIPFVVCGNNHNPVAFLLPLDGNYRQGAVMDSQVAASLPLNKNLWKDVVKQKIMMQAALLDLYGKNALRLLNMAKNVRSGDVDNLEGQAARIYWTELFGEDFKRDRNQDGINALLNYGYTILRSATLRYIVAAGLHPTLGIHHQNYLNDARLADDLMEPFRPFVDALVYKIAQKEDKELSVETKQLLVSVLSRNVPTKAGFTEIAFTLQSLCISLAKVYLGERKELDFTLIPKGIEWETFFNV